MITTNGNYGQDIAILSGAQLDPQVQAERAAQRLYQRTQFEGWLYRAWAAMTGQSSRLRDLHTAEASMGMQGAHYLGTQTVSINAIRGSESRCDDFDAHFCPLQEESRQRWTSVARAWQLGVPLPAIQLIQLGDTYFVRDGHHRVSVARAYGQRYIEASVTVRETTLE